MLFIIAWRNIWRSPARSLVVMGAIALGVWSAIFLMSFSYGMMEQRISSVLQTELSHAQVHHPEFPRKQAPNLIIPDGEAIISGLKTDERITGYSPRLTTPATVLKQGKEPAMVRLRAVIPELEDSVTHMSALLDSGGTWLSGTKSMPIVLSRRLAEDMDLRVKSRVQLNFMSADSLPQSIILKVTGLFHTDNSQFDRSTAFARAEDIRSLLHLQEGQWHEIAFMSRDRELADEICNELTEKYPASLSQTWKQISPDMAWMTEYMDIAMLIFMGIIMFALIFGIINTMLMAVLERSRELGMLLALGMNRSRVFSMIMLETILLSFTAGLFGMLLGWLTVSWLGGSGIDLSAFSKGMESMGFSAIVYLKLSPKYYVILAGMVVGTAMVASTWPARRAIRLKPAEAIRKI